MAEVGGMECFYLRCAAIHMCSNSTEHWVGDESSVSRLCPHPAQQSTTRSRRTRPADANSPLALRVRLDAWMSSKPRRSQPHRVEEVLTSANLFIYSPCCLEHAAENPPPSCRTPRTPSLFPPQPFHAVARGTRTPHTFTSDATRRSEPPSFPDSSSTPSQTSRQLKRAASLASGCVHVCLQEASGSSNAKAYTQGKAQAPQPRSRREKSAKRGILPVPGRRRRRGYGGRDPLMDAAHCTGNGALG